MKFLKRSDAKFIEAAADDVKRRRAIRSYTTARNRIFWCAIVISLCGVVSAFSTLFAQPPHRLTSVLPAAFCFVVIWTIFQRLDADLRLFKLVERLREDR